MTLKLKSNLKYTVGSLLISIPLSVFCVLSILLQIKEQKFYWEVSLFALVLFLLVVFYVYRFLYETQWVTISYDTIKVKSLLGTVEEIQIEKIKGVYTKYVSVGQIKMSSFFRKGLIVSKTKTRKHIEGCYAKRKNGYVVIMDIGNNISIIKNYLTRNPKCTANIKII